MDMLTVREVAELKGCSHQYVKKIIAEGKLPAEQTLNGRNRPQYLIPLSALDAKLQKRYYQEHTAAPKMQELPATRPLDHYSEEERKEIAFWTSLLEEWESYRNKPAANKTVVDKEFVLLCKLRYPELEISTDTLYRKRRALRSNNLDGLFDKRGKWRKGKSSIHPELWDTFLWYYLDEAQHPLKRCYEYAKIWAQSERPELAAEIPDYSTFRRHVQSDVSNELEILAREGEKAYRDRCAPYIRRTYDDMESNDWWIADNHTFDILSRNEDGKIHRLYLTAYFDARSGIFTGCYVTTAPCSQATLIALRKGILAHGSPKNLYVDNGREFLTHDIGGLGHRKKKPKSGEEPFDPPPVFKRLGINMTNAIVRNARAKIIERRFLDIKNQLSRLFPTYTGGSVAEKPERLKDILKDGVIPTDQELTAVVEELLEWSFNMQPYGGAVRADRGKPRIQVYNENLHELRKASAEDLNLMLMRSSRKQNVGRLGVHLDVAGQRLYYHSPEMKQLLFGKEVYFRYDPDDLSEVRIYDLEDRFITTAPADNRELRYGAATEEVKQAMRDIRQAERVVKEALKAQVLAASDRPTALELRLNEARHNRQENGIPPAAPKVINIQRVEEQPLLRKVAGGIDLDRMNQNSSKRQEGRK